MEFDIIDEIKNIVTISKGSGIRDLSRLIKYYGQGHWRKMKGIATVRLPDDTLREAEIHWYESHGIGKREFKIKRLLPE